jgi:glycosyltransferase involved in cell wall biosynthesis
MLARFGETWVLTRANNRDAIEAHLPTVPEAQRLRFIYVDLPAWARFWKRGQRGVRLYYFLWQLAAVRIARRLHREVGFDLVWHLTFANAWLGSVGPWVRCPFVWGPVGGGAGTPWRLAAVLGVRGVLYEVVRAAARFGLRHLNPLSHVAWARARLILVQNAETLAWLPARHRARAVVFPNAVLEDRLLGGRRRRLGPPSALFAGRLLPWKGVALALRALALAPEWRLLVAGSGPDGPRLRRLARRLGVAERVRFLGWIPRDEVLRVMREEADLFLYPSLHDDSPVVVVEALASGLPVVCLDRGGPPLLGGAAVAAGGCDETVRRLARALVAGAGPSRAVSRLGFEQRVRDLGSVLAASGLPVPTDGTAVATGRVGPGEEGRRWR